MADQKLIFKKLFILVIAMFVLDRGLGAALEHFFFVKTKGFDARANYVINKTHADVLIFGSSRATEHYNANLLADSLHYSVYNAGRDLSYIFYHYALLETVLKRYSPKLIVLDTRPNEFKVFANNEDYDLLNVLLPFYDTHPELRDVCLLRGKLEKYKMLSKIYPYNSLILSEMVELLPFASYKKDDSENGYIAKTGRWTGPKETFTVNDEIAPMAAVYFKKFVSACKAKNVKLIIAFSPLYQKIDIRNNRNIAFVYQVAKEKGVPLINAIADPAFDNPKYFLDGFHLNREGADFYSNSIVDTLRKVLKSK